MASWLAWILAPAGPNDFAIRHVPGRPLAIKGCIPRAKASAIAGFFTNDLAGRRTATVRGTRQRGGLKLKIIAKMPVTDRQKVRNFLLEFLR